MQAGMAGYVLQQKSGDIIIMVFQDESKCTKPPPPPLRSGCRLHGRRMAEHYYPDCGGGGCGIIL